jgi:hypothetical protein
VVITGDHAAFVLVVRNVIINAMVTYDELRGHLGRRQFQPFRVLLIDGHYLDVIRTNQVVAMKRRLYAGVSDAAPLWIWLNQIDRLELIGTQAA